MGSDREHAEVQLGRDLGVGVLSFDMTAMQPHDFPELVEYNGLGVDVCP